MAFMQSGVSAVAFVHCVGTGIKCKLFSPGALYYIMNADNALVKKKKKKKHNTLQLTITEQIGEL